MAKFKERSETVRSWRELAEIINNLPDELKDKPVCFGDVRGDKEREFFYIGEFGTINDPNLYFDDSDDPPVAVEPGTIALFQ